jgi:hypothetical protein
VSLSADGLVVSWGVTPRGLVPQRRLVALRRPVPPPPVLPQHHVPGGGTAVLAPASTSASSLPQSALADATPAQLRAARDALGKAAAAAGASFALGVTDAPYGDTGGGSGGGGFARTSLVGVPGGAADCVGLLSRQAPGSCLALHPTEGDGCFYVGTADGGLARCSGAYGDRPLAALPCAHGGGAPVYRVAPSPFLPDALLTAGGDGCVRLWHGGSLGGSAAAAAVTAVDGGVCASQQSHACLTFTPPAVPGSPGHEAGGVVDVAWCPTASTVFASVTRGGGLQVRERRWGVWRWPADRRGTARRTRSPNPQLKPLLCFSSTLAAAAVARTTSAAAAGDHAHRGHAPVGRRAGGGGEEDTTAARNELRR